MAIDDDNYGVDGGVTADERCKVKKGIRYWMSHIDSDSVSDAIYGR